MDDHSKDEENVGYNQPDDVPMLDSQPQLSSHSAVPQHLSFPSPQQQHHHQQQQQQLISTANQPPSPYSFQPQAVGYDQPTPAQHGAPYAGQQVAGYPVQYPGAYPGQYPPPSVNYPHQPSAPVQQQQQQQSVVVVNTGQPNVVLPVLPYNSFSGHKALACFVFWCCAWIFGLIAYLLASSAESSQHTDPHGSRHLGRASIGVSIAGVVIGIIVVGVIIGVVYVPATSKYNQQMQSESSGSTAYASATCNSIYAHSVAGKTYKCKATGYYSSTKCYADHGYGSYYDASNYYCYYN